MSKKALNTSQVLSELTDKSAFFQKASPPAGDDGKPPRNHATVIPRYHDTTVEAIRKAVKGFGKEAATYRFTVVEKQQLGELVFKYRQNGIRTSENEITRIAINFLIEDHRSTKENSLLDQVLKALND